MALNSLFQRSEAPPPVSLDVPLSSNGTEALPVPIAVPLVLDLDRTLIKTDLLFESFAAALQRNPFILFLAIVWLLQGKAVLKRKLAAQVPLDVSLMPVNETVLRLAESEAALGRPIVLATAADEVLAHRIAKRFDFISRVFASDGHRNLKAEVKADVLSAAYPSGFIYAGDCTADLPVWRAACFSVVISSDRQTLSGVRMQGKPCLMLPHEPVGAAILLRALRMKQWSKNALVLAPIALAGMLGDMTAWTNAILTFLALGLVASATYLVNDLFDLADDRMHWSKRNRPLASGALPIAYGFSLVPVLILLGFGLASQVGLAVFAALGLYLVTTLAYSFALKRIPILDVATLAALFTLRLFMGVIAIGALISPWLFVFSMALFLSLSIAKRHTEVVRMVLHGHAKTAGRGYIVRDEPLLLAMGLSAALSAVVLFSLYLTGEVARKAAYTAPGYLWVAPIVLFLWLGRIWLLSQRGELDDDPVSFAIRDRASLMLGAVLGCGFFLAAFGGTLA